MPRLSLFALFLLLCGCQTTAATPTSQFSNPSLTITATAPMMTPIASSTETPLVVIEPPAVVPVSPFSENPPKFPPNAFAQFEHLQFINRQQGWAWGYSYDEAINTHWTVLIHTTNGGKTWKVNKLPDAAYFFYSAYPGKTILNNFAFSDGGFVWAGAVEAIVGDAGMVGVFETKNFYTSEDYGQTWTAHETVLPSLPPLAKDQSTWLIRRQDCEMVENTNAVGCELQVWRKPSGADWQTSASIIKGSSQFKVARVGADLGWVLYDYRLDTSGKFIPALIKTTDGGQTWHALTIPPIESSYYTLGRPLIEIQAISDKVLWLVIGHSVTGTEGTKAVFVSEDGGTTWELRAKASLNASENVGELSQFGYWVNFYASTNSTAFASVGGTGGLVGSFDGGRSWKTILLPTTALHTSEIFFVDEQAGWLLAQNTIFRTTDGGKTWQAAEFVPGLQNQAPILTTPTSSSAVTPYPIQSTPESSPSYP